MAAIQSEFGAIEQFVVVAELGKQDDLNDPQLYHVMDEYERYMSLDQLEFGRTFFGSLICSLLTGAAAAVQPW